MNCKPISFLLLGVLTFSPTTFGMRGEGEILDRPNRNLTAPQSEIVRWVGEIKENELIHTSEQEHVLTFTKQDDGRKYHIKDSPELVKHLHDAGRGRLIEIEAEKVPQFLFWGGYLLVRSFKPLEQSDREAGGRSQQ